MEGLTVLSEVNVGVNAHNFLHFQNSEHNKHFKNEKPKEPLDNRIINFGEHFNHKRSFEFRSDALNDINAGLSILASGIKVITSLLSLFGAEAVDRTDGYDDAVGTMLSIAATLLKIGVDKMLESTPDKMKDDVPVSVEGLPVPGTFQHSLALGIQNIERAIKRFVGSKTGNQQTISNKIGKVESAAGDKNEEGVVTSLKQSIGGAAYNLLRFVVPPTSPQVHRPGVTYSQVTTGIDPKFATLGLLGTGALGSVVYSYVAAENDFSALALGAVDKLKKIDVVQAATSAISMVTGNSSNEEEEKDDLDKHVYYSDDGYVNYSYYNADYPDYSAIYESMSKHPNIPQGTQFYEPETKSNSPSVPFKAYSDEPNPWEIMVRQQPTEHLYRAFHN